ncbi:hypothetical protein QFZ23_002514 [Arthrobacter globiformis]|uniref:hypothetical protein n=1 Tax=Arthrobacter globiformis TaxID=1665 RepID=UPI00277EBA7A|nr:hypothetical protein [Arthrobacter globiformis]MDQ1058613.1 hypothetical protein [Arthrobacter globiformis]
MATSHFRQFLHHATSPAPDTDIPLGSGCLYGLYTSWCPLQGMTRKSGPSFRAGTRLRRINIHNRRVRMKGRAAAGYILASYRHSA